MNYKTIQTAAGKIAFLDNEKKSKLPIVLIHGNSCSSEVFKKQFAYFGQRYRLVAIDLPGHGKSENAAHPDIEYTIPGYAKILDEVVNALNIDHFLAVGFSLGGNIALQWAQISQRIKGIMMISSAPMRYSEDALLAYTPYEGSYGAYPHTLSTAQATEFMSATGFDTNDPSVNFMIKDAIRTDGAARAIMVASVLAGKGVDETKIVSELELPLALVIGKDDQVIGIDYLKHLTYRNLWQHKIQLLNAQHAIVFHQSDQLHPLLDAFILKNN